ncbi:sugar transferase [Rhodobacteraceae bacterium KMM 6894]|nr:sugar transferase [Rhodobacteraceae bacterium KMM 6894]
MPLNSIDSPLYFEPATCRPFNIPLAPSDHQFYNNFGKRSLDITLCIMSAPFVLIVVTIASFLIMCGGGVPLYSQLRVGKNGHRFRLWKLRTMIMDADSKLESYLAENPDARAEWDRTQKLRNDPRVTRLGAMLRRTSIDELPQFWNVLKGDMSVAGPRPMLPEQEAIYPGFAYNSLRPGITGNWQVSDRNKSAFADRAAFDTTYSRTVSLRTDIGIFFATVRVVLKATGC